MEKQCQAEDWHRINPAQNFKEIYKGKYVWKRTNIKAETLTKTILFHNQSKEGVDQTILADLLPHFE